MLAKSKALRMCPFETVGALSESKADSDKFISKSSSIENLLVNHSYL